jgi:hypothetical protein
MVTAILIADLPESDSYSAKSSSPRWLAPHAWQSGKTNWRESIGHPDTARSAIAALCCSKLSTAGGWARTAGWEGGAGRHQARNPDHCQRHCPQPSALTPSD